MKIKNLFQFAWKICWVSVSLAVIFINLMLLTDAFMALTSSFWIPARARVVSTDGFISQARYRPYIDVTYEYYTDGQRYTNQKVCFLELPFGCPQKQLEEIAKYDASDSFTAYYSPFIPSNSVMIRKTESNQWIAFLISLPITWLGSWIAFLPGWHVIKNISKNRKS